MDTLTQDVSLWVVVYRLSVAITVRSAGGLLLLGLLWAPLGAFICNRIARSKGLDTGKYTGAGAGYSALFFLPWCYLVARMFGKVPPEPIVRIAYVWLYVCWLALIAGYGMYWYAENNLFSTVDLERHGLGKAIALAAIWFSAVAVQFSTWVLSVLRLRGAHARNRRKLGSTPRDILPGGMYVYPFVIFLVWIGVFPFLWVITYGIYSP